MDSNHDDALLITHEEAQDIVDVLQHFAQHSQNAAQHAPLTTTTRGHGRPRTWRSPSPGACPARKRQTSSTCCPIA
ncbi:hypothetical protein BX283_0252 [Streptomyces sp. TLI_146]|nr:hypothetical protein BX283_0252 [Streptomyces sp. TLI_146]